MLFPRPKIIIVKDDLTSRVRSLRDPEKKMSKSDPDWRSCVFVNDTPDVVAKKIKKAVTDLQDGVTFDPVDRPGLANLITLHCGFSGLTPEEVCQQVGGMKSGQYKKVVTEVVNEGLKPIREKISYYESNKDHLEAVLDKGANKARFLAAETMDSVRRLVGLTSH